MSLITFRIYAFCAIANWMQLLAFETKTKNNFRSFHFRSFLVFSPITIHIFFRFVIWWQYSILSRIPSNFYYPLSCSRLLTIILTMSGKTLMFFLNIILNHTWCRIQSEKSWLVSSIGVVYDRKNCTLFQTLRIILFFPKQLLNQSK